MESLCSHAKQAGRTAVRQLNDDRDDRHDATTGHATRAVTTFRFARPLPTSTALVAVVVLTSLVLGGGALGRGHPIAAQTHGATPAPASAAASPTADECRVEPRTVASLRRLNLAGARAVETFVAFDADADTAIALGLAPFNALTPVPEPSDLVLDPETFAKVTTAYRELKACSLTGEQLRPWALFTDDFFTRSSLFFGPWTEETLSGFTTPEPIPANERDTFVPLAPENLRRLPDGRVGVLSPAPAPQPGGAPPPSDTQMLIFIEQGDRYLVDDLLFVSAEATPIAANASLATPMSAEAPRTALAATPIIPGTTSMLAIEDGVSLHEAPAAAAPVVQTLTAGQLVRVSGSATVADGEKWWPITDLATENDGFVPDQLLIVARNELTFRSESTLIVDGTPVIITPGPVTVPTVTPIRLDATPAPGASPATGQ